MIYLLLAIIILAIISNFISYKAGQLKTKNSIAEDNLKAREEDAKITSNPYVDNPLSRMRNNKD